MSRSRSCCSLAVGLPRRPGDTLRRPADVLHRSRMPRRRVARQAEGDPSGCRAGPTAFRIRREDASCGFGARVPHFASSRGERRRARRRRGRVRADGSAHATIRSRRARYAASVAGSRTGMPAYASRSKCRTNRTTRRRAKVDAPAEPNVPAFPTAARPNRGRLRAVGERMLGTSRHAHRAAAMSVGGGSVEVTTQHVGVAASESPKVSGFATRRAIRPQARFPEMGGLWITRPGSAGIRGSPGHPIGDERWITRWKTTGM